MKTKIFTPQSRGSLAQSTFCWWRHNRVLMMSQWPDNCDTITWKVISNSLDIDFIHGDIHGRSFKNIGLKTLLYSLEIFRTKSGQRKYVESVQTTSIKRVVGFPKRSHHNGFLKTIFPVDICFGGNKAQWTSHGVLLNKAIKIQDGYHTRPLVAAKNAQYHNFEYLKTCGIAINNTKHNDFNSNIYSYNIIGCWQWKYGDLCSAEYFQNEVRGKWKKMN